MPKPRGGALPGRWTALPGDSLAAARFDGGDDLELVVATVEEGEFRDRAFLSLPGNQEELIARADTPSATVDERQVHHVLTPLGRAVLQAELDRLRRTITLAGRSRRPAER